MIIFQVGANSYNHIYIKIDDIALAVKDFIEDKEISDEEKAKLERIIKSEKELKNLVLENSKYSKQIKPYLLPFFRKKKKQIFINKNKL